MGREFLFVRKQKSGGGGGTGILEPMGNKVKEV